MALGTRMDKRLLAEVPLSLAASSPLGGRSNAEFGPKPQTSSSAHLISAIRPGKEAEISLVISVISESRL